MRAARDAVRALTEWDWRYWLEVQIDVAGAHITVDDASLFRTSHWALAAE